MMTRSSNANTVTTYEWGQKQVETMPSMNPCKDAVCDHCLEEVSTQMVVSLENIKATKAKKSRMSLKIAACRRISEMPPLGSCSSNVASPTITSPFFTTHATLGAQPSLESFNEKKMKGADIAMRSFCYHDNLSYNLVNSPFFHPMPDAIEIVGL